MNRYRVSESVLNRIEQVHSYDDLEIHHPKLNRLGLKTGRTGDFEMGRPHQRVEGEFEEVRLQPDGHLLVKKDFILSHDGSGPVRVPAPVAGYVHYLHDKTAAMRIYDRPFGEPGARLLAQSLHMNPRTCTLKEGSHIAYGQPMGVMSDTGTPGAIHAHIEAAPEQFRRYITDIESGVITPDRYPALSNTRNDEAQELPAIPSANTHSHAASVRATHQALRLGDTGTRVIELQQTLLGLGYRDPNGQPLAIDGTFGPNTKHAVQSFQRAHHLHVDGIVGKDTRAALKDAQHAPLLSEATNPQHVLYTQVLRGIHKLPQGTYRNEQERTNAAVALTISAHVEGLKHIDHVVLGKDGANLFAVQGRMDDPAHRRVYVDHAQAISQSMGHDAVALRVSQVQQSMHGLHASQAMHSQIEQRGAVLGISR